MPTQQMFLGGGKGQLGSEGNPATSAKELLTISAPSGNYYMTTPNGVKLLYADMSTDGGGWTMYARTNNTNDTSFNVRSDYGLSGTSPSTRFCAYDFKNARDTVSSTGECEYMFSSNNGAYKFKMSTFYLKGTNTVGNRTASNISGAGTLNSYISAGSLQGNAVLSWTGPSGNSGYAGGGMSDVGQSCKRDELFIGSWSQNCEIRTYSFNTPHSGSRCSDWCGQSGSYRTSRAIGNRMYISQTCYGGYSPGTTGVINITNFEIYFREK